MSLPAINYQWLEKITNQRASYVNILLNSQSELSLIHRNIEQYMSLPAINYHWLENITNQRASYINISVNNQLESSLLHRKRWEGGDSPYGLQAPAYPKIKGVHRYL
jgi:hypothetical protein